MNRAAPAAVALLSLLALPLPALEPREPIGYIESVEGAVFLQTDASGPEIRLSPSADVARMLRKGDRMRCGRGGLAKVRIGRQTEEVRSRAWVTLPTAPLVIPARYKRALDDYGRIGGVPRSDRGSAMYLYSPAPDSAASASAFAVRWTPGERRCPLSFAITTMDRQTIWRREAAGDAGSLDAAAARAALARFQAAGHVRFELTVSGRCINPKKTVFELLSPEDEAALNEELRDWDADGDGTLLNHLGRASVLAHYRLYPQAAEEYESALALAPESRDLLARTIAAEQRTNNVRRQAELEKRLSSAP